MKERVSESYEAENIPGDSTPVEDCQPTATPAPTLAQASHLVAQAPSRPVRILALLLGLPLGFALLLSLFLGGLYNLIAALIDPGQVLMLLLDASSVWAAWHLYRGHSAGWTWATFFYAIQIVTIALPQFSFEFYSGLRAQLALFPSEHAIVFDLGMATSFLEPGDTNTPVALNLFALGATLYLLRKRPRQQTGPESLSHLLPILTLGLLAAGAVILAASLPMSALHSDRPLGSRLSISTRSSGFLPSFAICAFLGALAASVPALVARRLPASASTKLSLPMVAAGFATWMLPYYFDYRWLLGRRELAYGLDFPGYLNAMITGQTFESSLTGAVISVPLGSLGYGIAGVEILAACFGALGIYGVLTSSILGSDSWEEPSGSESPD